MYPYLISDAIFYSYKLHREDVYKFVISNEEEEELEISEPLWNALSNMQLGESLTVLPDWEHILPQIKQRGVVTESRLVPLDAFYNIFILFPIYSHLRSVKIAFRILYFLLPIVSIIAFLHSLRLCMAKGLFGGISYHALTWIPAYFLLSLFQFVGTLIAQVAYDYNVPYFGIVLTGFIPLGFITDSSPRRTLSISEQVQVNLSGSVAILLPLSIFMLLAIKTPSLSSYFLPCSVFSFIYLVLMLAFGFDFTLDTVLSIQCGVNSFYAIAKADLFNKHRRKELLSSGFLGYITLLSHLFVLSFRIFLTFVCFTFTFVLCSRLLM